MIALNRTVIVMLLVACVLSRHRPAVAADNPPAEADAKNVVTHVYHVQDLLLIVQNYPLRSALLQPTQVRGRETNGGAIAGPATTQPSNNADPEERLHSFLVNLIEPSSWKDYGGEFGSMTLINGDLFVTQTPANHTAIERLLADVRKTATTIVRLRVDWVWLEPGDLGAILAGGAADTSPTPIVNRSSPQMSKEMIACSASISCFNGQTVHIASGRARSMTTAATAVVAQGAVAFDPVTEIVQCGNALQATAVLSENGTATVDLMSVVSDWSPPNAADANKIVTGSSVNGLDRIEAVVQHFHTTVQVPLNKPVLIGGMTFNPTTEGPVGKQLYLVLEADAAK